MTSAVMRRAIEAHLGTPQVARVIYGAIIGLALVVALEAHPPPAGVVVATLLGTALAVGLAELYSAYVGTEVQTRARVGREHLAELWSDVVAVAFGISFPAVFFVLAAAGTIDVDRAFDLAKWTGLGLISFYGFCAGRLAGGGLLRSICQAVAAAMIGAILIVLKSLVH